MAKNGGVLTRAGHTEAGCDLAKLAGLEPSSVIVEILNEDEYGKKRFDGFSKTQFKIGTIEELIKYRVSNEKPYKESANRSLKLNMVHLHQSFIRIF